MDSSLLNIFHQLYDFSLYLRNHKIKFCLIGTKKEINNSKLTQQGGRKKRKAKRSCATLKSDRTITNMFCGDLNLS